MFFSLKKITSEYGMTISPEKLKLKTFMEKYPLKPEPTGITIKLNEIS